MFENCVRIMAREYEDDDDERTPPTKIFSKSIFNEASFYLGSHSGTLLASYCSAFCWDFDGGSESGPF